MTPPRRRWRTSPTAASDRLDAATLDAELLWVSGLLQTAAELGLARCAAGATVTIPELPAARRRALARALDPLVEAHAPIWLARNRPGGRLHSRRRLERTLALLR